jgi:xanthine dehydrogenase YagS FAD-binding subunit
VVIRGGRIRTARLALGGVATKPWRTPGAERLLEGAAPSDELFVRAAAAAVAGATPHGDNAFKVELARRVVRRALAQVSGLASEG